MSLCAMPPSLSRLCLLPKHLGGTSRTLSAWCCQHIPCHLPHQQRVTRPRSQLASLRASGNMEKQGCGWGGQGYPLIFQSFPACRWEIPMERKCPCSVRAVNAKTGLKTTTMGCEMCPRVRQGEGLPPLAPVSASPHWCEPTCSAWYMGTDTMHRQCASFSICGYSAALIPVVIRRLVHFLVPAKGEKPTLLSEVEIIEESLNEGTKKL